jgi:hypothetical protein
MGATHAPVGHSDNHLDRLLLLGGQAGEAVGEGVGDAQCISSPTTKDHLWTCKSWVIGFHRCS